MMCQTMAARDIQELEILTRGSWKKERVRNECARAQDLEQAQAQARLTSFAFCEHDGESIVGG